MTSGGYQLKPELPFVSGLEFAGEVDAVGKGVAGWSAGDAVVGGNRFGAMAEYAVVPASALRPKPESLSWDEAAAYPVAYLTARSEEHTSELQSLMRISYAVFCLKKKTIKTKKTYYYHH